MATEKTALDVRFRAFIKGVVGSDEGLGSRGTDVTDQQTFDANEHVTFGTDAGEANQWWYDCRILAASQTDSLDLASGLTTPTVHTIVGLVLKGIFIHNRSDETLTALAHGVAHTANAAALEVTRPAANGVPWLKAAGDAVEVGPGGWFAWYDPIGIAITAGTGDLIDIIETAAAEAAYDIVLLFEE